MLRLYEKNRRLMHGRNQRAIKRTSARPEARGIAVGGRVD